MLTPSPTHPMPQDRGFGPFPEQDGLGSQVGGAVMSQWLNRVHFGDCLETLRRMPDGIVNTCVTSPPYFGLRSYMPNAVKLRGDINPEELESVLKELERLGVSQCGHTSE